MKKVFFALTIAFVAVGCVSNPDGEKAETTNAAEVSTSTEGTVYKVDPSASTLEWTGRKVTGQHNGTINITEGSLTASNGALSGGNFVIDMNSLVDSDITDAEMKAKLEGHLKSDDFFATDKFPTSKFEITKVEDKGDGKITISGNLTIRDITKNITFDAVLAENTPEKISANADFNINRKDWNIQYTGMKDDLISDEINFKVKLVSAK